MHATKLSVRNLVEFITRSGDLTTSSGLRDADAMLQGTRIHKKLQRRMGSGYRAEVSLSGCFEVTCDGLALSIILEGRADGIFTEDGIETIDEIKGIYAPIHKMETPVPVHRAQALCYAFLYAQKHSLACMGIRMTYCHIPTEEVKYFTEKLTFDELKEQFFAILNDYAKWMAWQIHWQTQRDASLKALDFPFPYREGQEKLVKDVYRSILRQKRLYIEAPTGVGKTISTVFPAVKSIGEGLTEKVFYLTAKTITRTVAENTFALLQEQGACLKCVTLTAKEKICLLDKPACNPRTCERAKGHFDRVNDAMFDVLTHETLLSRDIILAYAEAHSVCPFELSLDLSSWCDVIIGDYNYVFDPTASLKRFFGTEAKNDYVFLIDEAHNLVDRAREMYSATLVKEDFLAMKKLTRDKNRKISTALEGCNRLLLERKRECDDRQKFDAAVIEPFVLRTMRLTSLLEEYLQGNAVTGEASLPLAPEESEQLLQFYFSLRAFQNVFALLDASYIIYGDYSDNGNFRLHLRCMDPSANLDNYLKKCRCSVFFSATLLPIGYYREQLAGREDDYAVYAPSPFSADKRLFLIGRDVSTKYTRRSRAMYEKIARYITAFALAKAGNYMVFFPSYQMLSDVKEYLTDPSLSLCTQSPSMTEQEREAFLSHFEASPGTTTVGLCVMGGIFGEGIDLKEGRLIGAVIVGTGLPMVCAQNELYREYFDEKKGMGFSYAYQYPGMNKVQQAAGRVIRTTEDVGAILLLDDRFLQESFQALFPREWFPYEVVTLPSMEGCLKQFWEKFAENKKRT